MKQIWASTAQRLNIDFLQKEFETYYIFQKSTRVITGTHTQAVLKNKHNRPLKGEFIQKAKQHIFPLKCSAIYPSRMFWCELQSFGDISQRDVCLLVIIIGLVGIRLVVLKAPKKYI